MHTLANKISARERETAPKYYYKVSILNFRTELNWESFFFETLNVGINARQRVGQEIQTQ